MTVDVGTGWRLTFDLSPEWLFCRLSRNGAEASPEPSLAQSVWSIAEEHQLRRLVFELDEEVRLTSYLVGQFVLLHKRAELARGTFRLCGITAFSFETIHLMGLASRFPNYRNREDAVMGRLP
ncbi:MAG: hypothetical protein KF861_12750 [Planctomycetaceae bacterium]|nr:hypothetical protein [Planctomycetaceae bacterium]